MIEKKPPLEKIYEAWSAVASGRVRMLGSAGACGGEAEISSSGGGKSYTVVWTSDNYRSNDPATYWQGYPGYPLIAVLMLTGRLPWDAAMATLFKDVNWTEANKKARGDYALALENVCAELGLGAEEVDAAHKAANTVMEALLNLPVDIGPLRQPKKAGNA